MKLTERIALCCRILRAKPDNLLAHADRELPKSNGVCFTNRDSRKVVTCPYWPKTEYVDVPEAA